MCKMTVKMMMLLTIFCIFLTGCTASTDNAKATRETKASISVEELEELRTEKEQLVNENEQLKVENAELKDTIKGYEKVQECQTNLANIKKFVGYSEEDLKKLQEEFEQFMQDPKAYHIKGSEKLFYYVCVNTDVIKDLYNTGHVTQAEDMIYIHMHWSGEFKSIKDFIKVWMQEISEDSNWNNMLYDECVKAFDTFKYYPEDLEAARELLPSEFVSKIEKMHKERDVFPDGISKEDFE